MTFTVAVANLKGGVGKTTTAANVADTLARQGRRVLLVDLAHSATRLTQAVAPVGVDAYGRSVPVGVGDALLAAFPRPYAEPMPGTVAALGVAAGEHWSDQLRVAPTTHNGVLEWNGRERFAGSFDRLRIGLLGAAYDVVVIDSPPGLSPLSMNALVAADALLLVTDLADMAVTGLTNTLAAGADLDRLEVLGVVVTRTVHRDRIGQDLLEYLQDDREGLGLPVLACVPRRAGVGVAESAGVPLRALGADGRDLTACYDQVAQQLLDAGDRLSLTR